MKKHIQPYNDKKQAHGLWIWYYSTGETSCKGQYINGIIHGYWISNWTIVKPDIVFYIK